MIEGLGPKATALLEEAHRDVPSHLVREQMWGGIATGIAAGAIATSAVATGSAATSAKAVGLSKFLLGALVGGLLSAGVMAFTAEPARITQVSAPLGAPPVHRVGLGGGFGPVAAPAGPSLEPVAAVADEVLTQKVALAPSKAITPVVGHPSPAMGVATPVSAPTEGPYARETRLMNEAHMLLKRGGAEEALKKVREARGAPTHALELEEMEMAIEARALRDLYRVPEAEALEAEMASRFPGNQLVP